MTNLKSGSRCVNTCPWCSALYFGDDEVMDGTDLGTRQMAGITISHRVVDPKVIMPGCFSTQFQVKVNGFK